MPSLEETDIFDGAYDDEDVGVKADLNNLETTMNVSPIPTTRIHKDHPKDQIIKDLNLSNQTRRMINFSKENAMVSYISKQRRTNHKDYQNCLFAYFLSQNEPKKVIQALTDPSWIEAMQEDLLQFKLQKVWTLVDLPKGKRAIGTKWVYRNKKDERGIVVRNEARLMDVKSAFLYGTIEEEVYVCQPPSFEDPQFPDKVYKVEKALYGLHQAPIAWYQTLSTYLLENDIIFGSTKKSLCVEFEQMIHKRFQMSSIGELTFFLGLPAASTPIETNKALNKDEEAEDVDVHLYRSMIGSLMYLTASKPDIMFAVCACARDSPFNLEAFSDSDYAGASLDRKSTTGGCQFLGKRLISWQCKKQTIVANSTTKAEYVAAANCCGQVLWIQNQMLDYGFNFMNTKIHIDNESTICIVKNPVFHSKTKHIEIRHHFIRDSYEKKLIQVIKIHTDHNVADFLTKAFDASRKAKRTTKISQSSRPIHLVVDETVYKEWEDRMERAATIVSSLEAEQDSDSGEVQITATIDVKVKLVSKASIRRHLKLEDSDGITTFPNTEIFKQLTRMGHGEKLRYNMRRASKGYTGVDIPLFPTILVQGLIMPGEGSTVLVESHHTPSGAPTTSQPPLSSPSRIPTRQETDVPQPSSPTYNNVADEAAFTSVDVVHGEAATTVSSKDVGQGSVDSLETKLKQTKQTYGAALTKLIKKVKKLEKTVKTSQARRRAKIVGSDDEESSEDTSKQGRMIEDIDQDAGISLVTPTKVSNAAKKIVNTYTRRRKAVSTGSERVSTASRIFSIAEESVSTAGASMPVSTAGMVQQVNIIIPSSSETTKDKGKTIMQESEQPKKIKKRVQIQMSLDEELAQKLHEEEQARFNAEQEAKFNAEQEELLASETTKDEANPSVPDNDWDDVQAQIQADEDLAQKLLEEERENISIEERARLLTELIDKRKKLQAAQRYKA
ncbi:putative ribonuclease H-like domain-containing protein [Tanacetum coccineum]